MTWATVLVALLVSHVVGDVLLQTDWQAMHKLRGLGDRVARRALFQHVILYTAAFAPALIWIGNGTSTPRAAEVGALVAVPHLLVDDGHVVRAWLRDIKGAADPTLGLSDRGRPELSSPVPPRRGARGGGLMRTVAFLGNVPL